MFEFVAVGGVQHPRNGPADNGAVRLHRPRPACLDEALRFGAPGVPGEKAGGALLLGAQQQDLAGVGVR